MIESEVKPKMLGFIHNDTMLYMQIAKLNLSMHCFIPFFLP